MSARCRIRLACSCHLSYISRRYGKSRFPHGFSATDHLVPPSEDGLTPLTDNLPRSIILDPSLYKSKTKFRSNAPKGHSKLSNFEKQIFDNPFAQILGSPIREDRMAARSLPRELLLKFALFQDTQNGRSWLLPADLPSSSPVMGNTTYTLNRMGAIHDLGRKKKWQGLVPLSPFVTDQVRKRLVWRDGMDEYILALLREEAWKRVDGLRQTFLFHVAVDTDLENASVGQRLNQRSTRLNHETGPNGLEERASEPKDTSRAEGKGKSPPPRDEVPHISGVLYLESPSSQQNWDFKPINIQNQSTQATIFNLRRLFPYTAESLIRRLVRSENAVAIHSSSTVLRHLLRLSLYLVGTNRDEHHILDEGRAEKSELGRTDSTQMQGADDPH